MSEYNLENLKDELKKNVAQLLDVREVEEWREGHLKDAKLVPLSELRVGLEPENLAKEVKTYIHCRSGNRVQMAKPLLEEMGFEDVVALQEGFEELAASGFEVAN